MRRNEKKMRGGRKEGRKIRKGWEEWRRRDREKIRREEKNKEEEKSKKN